MIGGNHMKTNKAHIALELTKAMIQEKTYLIDGLSNEGAGQAAARIFNAVFSSLNLEGSSDECEAETPNITFEDNLQ